MMTDQPVVLGAGTSLNFLYRHAEHHADPNENSVVVRLDYGSHRLLLAGDAEGGERKPPGAPPDPTSIEGDLLAHNPSGIKADVLIVGHHGSKTSSRAAFIDAVGATIFVISSGPHPYQSVHLPDPEIEAELRSNGRTLLETTVHDLNDECATNGAKIGPDADESPGGCDNVLVIIPPSGPISADYNRISD
jgi:competence protein ComEC